MIVEIKQRHIAIGQPRCACHCPVVLAFWDLGYDVEVSDNAVTWWDEGSCYAETRLPREAITFVERFDRGAEVGPFQFEIEEPI